MKVTFIDHSGVMIDCGKQLLIFDYVKGNIHLPLDKEIYFFISHRHHDHFNESLFKLQHPSCFILYDEAIGNYGHYPCKAHQVYQLNNLTIKTLASNDEGLGFIVSINGQVILHPGDLHLWKWPLDKNDGPKEIAEIDRLVAQFENELALISQEKYHLIFGLVDYRLEENTYLGLNRLFEKVQFDYCIPIHFWNDFEKLSALANYSEKLLIPRHKMEEFDL